MKYDTNTETAIIERDDVLRYLLTRKCRDMEIKPGIMGQVYESFKGWLADRISYEDPYYSSTNRLLGRAENLIVSGDIKKIPDNMFDQMDEFHFRQNPDDGEYKLPKFKNITIENGVKEIGAEAFNEVTAETLSLPDSLEKINRGAFRFLILQGGVKNRMTLSIPDSVQEIEDQAFENAWIETLSIPKCKTGKNIFFDDSITVRTKTDATPSRGDLAEAGIHVEEKSEEEKEDTPAD